MKWFTIPIPKVVLTVLFCCLLVPAVTAAADFPDWLAALRTEALEQGITAGTLNAALTGLEPIPRVLELDRRQPEFTQTFWDYLDKRVSPARIAAGRKLLAEHAELLKTIEQRYGVQPRFLVAFWGLETNFGTYVGDFSTIGALVTLAYDPRRSDFFRRELLAALRIIDQGHITAEAMKGSWAGAMGQLQFMPTTFVNFAVDQDGNGYRDIWHNLPDIFGSAANFLSQSGWDGDRTWGREVQRPDHFDLEKTGLDIQKPLAAWQAEGIRRMNGDDLPAVDIKASVILPAGYNGPSFLVYQNYRTILNWNRSHLYALAVGHLADRLTGKGPLVSRRPANEIPLKRAQVIDMQQLLVSQGYDPGPADGIIGAQSRTAIKQYQRANKLPADGYPTMQLLEKLQM